MTTATPTTMDLYRAATCLLLNSTAAGEAALLAVIDARTSQDDAVRESLAVVTGNDYDWSLHPAGTPEYDAAFIRSELRTWVAYKAQDDIAAADTKGW